MEALIKPNLNLGWLFKGVDSREKGKECRESKVLAMVLCLLMGSGLYGFSIGLWRSPEQALYVAIKFPLLMLLTTMGTLVLNWTLSQLIGVAMSMKDCATLILKCYSMISIVLGSLSPVSLFVLYNTPSRESLQGPQSYNALLLLHVLLISFAGIVCQSRLFYQLHQLCKNKTLAIKLFLIWLTAHLLLGSQLSWNLRPFFGNPELPVQFFRPDSFSGNFFEALLESITSLL